MGSNGHPREALGEALLRRNRATQDVVVSGKPVIERAPVQDEGAYLCGCRVAAKKRYSLDLFPDGKGGEVLRARTDEQGHQVCPERGSRLAGHRTATQIRKGQRSVAKPAGI